MAEYAARVSFYDMQESPVDAVLSVADGHLAIEVSGRPIGRWPIDELSPQLSGESVVVSAEGERLVIDVTDPDTLRVALRLPDSAQEIPSQPEMPHETHTASTDSGVEAAGGRQIADQAPSAAPPSDRSESSASISAHTARSNERRDSTPGEGVEESLREEISNLEKALEVAQTQLRWVQELVPRRLPIPIREDEAGLGVVQGVRLKERRPLPGSDGLQPWVVVDSGNVYVTDMRLIFSGVTDVEFEFDEINKKGASPTGLLLGVSSRTQSQILAGLGERLAVVLTAAEKLGRGLDPTVPFKEAISRITSEIDEAEGWMESTREAATSDRPPLDQAPSRV